MYKSSLSQTLKVGSVCIIANFVFPILQFSTLFAPTDVSKYEMRNEMVCDDCISRLLTLWFKSPKSEVVHKTNFNLRISYSARLTSKTTNGQ